MFDAIWISRGECQRRLGVSSPILARLVAEGQIGSLSLPGIKRKSYSAADVNRLVANGMVPAKSEDVLVEA